MKKIVSENKVINSFFFMSGKTMIPINTVGNWTTKTKTNVCIIKVVVDRAVSYIYYYIPINIAKALPTAPSAKEWVVLVYTTLYKGIDISLK